MPDKPTNIAASVKASRERALGEVRTRVGAA